jgi:hypothetical protein
VVMGYVGKLMSSKEIQYSRYFNFVNSVYLVKEYLDPTLARCSMGQ